MLARLQEGFGVESSFMPHGMCYLWEPELLWLHVISDGLIWLAYFAIPPALIYFVIKARQEVPADAPYGYRSIPYAWMFWAFGLFIVACGITHFMNIWTVWEPRYWVSGGFKVLTAVSSIATAVALPPLIPKALDLIRDARTSEMRRVQLEEANEELERLNRELKTVDRLRTEFFTNVSHELRTPLQLILGPTAELLEDPDRSSSDAERLSVIDRNARALLDQVNDLMDVARLQGGAMPLNVQGFDLAAAVKNVAESFRVLARSRNIDLSVDVPDELAVRSDRNKVERILLNLLSNAFKFTPAGGVVRCVVRSRAQDDDARLEESAFAQIIVEDSGPGVPEGARRQVFERFRQLEGTTTRKVGGAGIGLAIVNEFTELLGGFVTVADSPEGGASFTVLIPSNLSEAAGEGTSDSARDGGVESGDTPLDSGLPDPDPVELHLAHLENQLPDDPDDQGYHVSPAGAADDARPHVLVIDDSEDIRQQMTDVLKATYRVSTARDGRSAGLALQREAVDLVLLDLMLPETSGEEILESLRDDPSTSDVPVIVLTARAEPELAAELLTQGAQDYVVKPVLPAELRARADNLVELTRARRILMSGESEDLPERGRADVLAQKVLESRQELARSLREKSVLLQELHHRVKGNLQTISSLMSIEMRGLEDPACLDALNEMRQRIITMALVHENLYLGSDPAALPVAGYLRQLVGRIVRALAPDPERVDVDVSCEDGLTLDLDQAIPLGLLVHELVANAVEHALAPAGGGRIQVRLFRDDHNHVSLVVMDDGAGSSGPHSVEGRQGLGFVEALARGLGGRLLLSHENGGRAEVTFPVRNKS